MNEAYITSFGSEELGLLNREDAYDTKEEERSSRLSSAGKGVKDDGLW